MEKMINTNTIEIMTIEDIDVFMGVGGTVGKTSGHLVHSSQRLPLGLGRLN